MLKSVLVHIPDICFLGLRLISTPWSVKSDAMVLGVLVHKHSDLGYTPWSVKIGIKYERILKVNVPEQSLRSISILAQMKSIF